VSRVYSFLYMHLDLTQRKKVGNLEGNLFVFSHSVKYTVTIDLRHDFIHFNHCHLSRVYS